MSRSIKMYFNIVTKLSLFNVNSCLYISSFLLIIHLSITPVIAQKKLTNLLNLKGQTRLDSLEYHYTTFWEECDSVVFLKEINSVKRFATDKNDPFLLIFTDYLKMRYYLQGKQKNREHLEQFIYNLQKRLSKQKPSLMKEHLTADLEHSLGTLLYRSHIQADKVIGLYLSADLFYRKIGYENIVFPDNKLTHLGLYYYDEVADFETALSYMKEAEVYVPQNPIDKYRIAHYKAHANCLVGLGKYQEAIRYNQLAIAQVKLKRDSLKIGTLSGNIGEIIMKTSANPIEAEPYFLKELVYRLKYKPQGTDDLAKVYGNLCQTAGIKRNSIDMVNYYQKAISTLNDFVKVTKDTVDAHNILMSVYKNRMIADTLLGDYQSAYRFERLFYEELMAAHRQDLKELTSEVSIKFDAEKNKLRVELANQQVKNTRFWVVVISLLLLLVIIGSYLIYYRQRVNKNQLTRKLIFEQKEAERLAALNELKTRFFTNISHEFRTPLTLLLGPIDDLQKKYPQENIIVVMQRNLNRLQVLINQILDLSKLEAGEMKTSVQEVNLSLFLEHIFASFESLAQSKFIIFNHSQSHVQQFGKFDLDNLEKIVTNLLSNAFKFTPENGRIIVRVDYKIINEIGQLCIRIQDFGIGIPAERLPYIFDRFFQVDDSNQRQHDGTGIGLSLVKELINLLDGEIHVKSQLGEGTTFEVKIPFIALNEPTQNSEKLVRKESVVLSASFPEPIRKTVIETDKQNIMLIVEDNSDLRNYISSVFEDDYQLVTAINGEDGLQKTLQYIPDIIVCDLMMPKLDGLGFCDKLRNDERINHIPVVMLTAKASLSDKLVGLSKGADDYLSKPFNREELTIRVSNLITQRQLMREKFAMKLATHAEIVKDVSVTTMDDSFIQKAKIVIDQNIDQSSFDVDTFANGMNLSSVQLRRKLKAITNQTVTEFVRNYRLELAAEKLRNKSGTVSEIAYQVGFDSLPYFSKVFLEKYGKTPSDWK